MVGGIVVSVIAGGGVVVGVGEGVGSGVVAAGAVVVGWVVGGVVVLSCDAQDVSNRANTIKQVRTKTVMLFFIMVTPFSQHNTR